MATTTRIKCSGHAFELASLTPLGEIHKLTLVQRSNCGTPIGALDPTVGPQIETLQRDMAAIDGKLFRVACALLNDRLLTGDLLTVSVSYELPASHIRPMQVVDHCAMGGAIQRAKHFSIWASPDALCA